MASHLVGVLVDNIAIGNKEYDTGSQVKVDQQRYDDLVAAGRFSDGTLSDLGEIVESGGADLSGYVPKTSTYAAPGSGEGFDRLVEIDYDTDDPSLPEPWMIRVRRVVNSLPILTKSFWINESGLPRAWAVRKNEPAAKFHAYVDNTDDPIAEFRGPWDKGAIRRLGISGRGLFLMGPDKVIAVPVVVLGLNETRPANLPTGILIARRNT